MIERIYETFKLADGRKQLTVKFKDTKYILVSTFLIVDVCSSADWIKEAFDKVLSGRSKYEELDGHMCGVEMFPVMWTRGVGMILTE